MPLLALLLPLFASAAEVPAESENAVAFHATAGTEDFHELALQGRFRIDDTFDTRLRLQHERERGTGAAGEAVASIGARFHEVLHGRAAFVYELEPNRIHGFGFRAALDWTANPRDEDEHEAIISLSFASTTFRQHGSPNVTLSRQLSQRFTRREWILAWEQEISRMFRTTVFAEVDSYASAQGTLVHTATDFRRRPFAVGDGSVKGFPHYAFGVAGALRLHEDWRMRLDYSHAELVFTESNSDTFRPAVEFQIDNDWWLGGHAAWMHQDVQLTELAAGLSLTHEF